jgi:hypothetical protein
MAKLKKKHIEKLWKSIIYLQDKLKIKEKIFCWQPNDAKNNIMALAHLHNKAKKNLLLFNKNQNINHLKIKENKMSHEI